MVEHESAEEEAMHTMHDSPWWESQMEAHIESMMDMRLTMGSAIEEEQSDALTLSTMMAVADPYPLEMLEVDGIVMQGASRQQELLDMLEHPSLGRHWDEAQIDVLVVSRAAAFLVGSTPQEYIDGAYSISCPLWPIIERVASFYR